MKSAKSSRLREIASEVGSKGYLARAQERAAQRAVARAPEVATLDKATVAPAAAPRPALPSAAAAALARAKAKAAERSKP